MVVAGFHPSGLRLSVAGSSIRPAGTASFARQFRLLDVFGEWNNGTRDIFLKKQIEVDFQLPFTDGVVVVGEPLPGAAVRFTATTTNHRDEDVFLRYVEVLFRQRKWLVFSSVRHRERLKGMEDLTIPHRAKGVAHTFNQPVGIGTYDQTRSGWVTVRFYFVGAPQMLEARLTGLRARTRTEVVSYR